MITSETRPISKLSVQDKNRMYDLLRNHFLGTSESEFEHDLAEKECVMILREEETNLIVGFSTLVSFSVELLDRTVPVVFSGDTVVLEHARSSIGFGREISQYFQVVRGRHPDKEVYYILTTKGWRTYRILPFFFKEFYPNYQAEIPAALKQIVDAFCKKKYTDLYDVEKGLLVSGSSERQRLHSDTIDCVPSHHQDQHITFFAQHNPNYLWGDELVCIASIAEGNIAAGLRRCQFKQTERGEIKCEVVSSYSRMSPGL